MWWGGGGREGAAKHKPVSGILVEEGHTLGAYFCENGSRILLEEGHTSGGLLLEHISAGWALFLEHTSRGRAYFWSIFRQDGHTSGAYIWRTGILLEARFQAKSKDQEI